MTRKLWIFALCTQWRVLGQHWQAHLLSCSLLRRREKFKHVRQLHVSRNTQNAHQLTHGLLYRGAMCVWGGREGGGMKGNIKV